jgi:hypothetical protein
MIQLDPACGWWNAQERRETELLAFASEERFVIAQIETQPAPNNGSVRESHPNNIYPQKGRERIPHIQ